MHSFRDNGVQDELFTLRIRENSKDKCKTISPLCHPLIYSMRNDTLIKSHNDFSTRFDICYDDTAIDPPNCFLSDYTRAIAICEEFFISTPLVRYEKGRYKALLLEKVRNELTPYFDSFLLNQIERYIDYYMIKERAQLERKCFSQGNNDQQVIRDKMRNLKEEIAIMDLDYGFDHFIIRKRKKKRDNDKHHEKVSLNHSDCNKVENKSIEKNILIQKLKEKDKEKELHHNHSQPLLNLQQRAIDNITINPLSTAPYQTKAVTSANISTISNIFTSIYQNTPVIVLNKRKLSAVQGNPHPNPQDSANDNDNQITLSIQRSVNKPPISPQFADQPSSQLRTNSQRAIHNISNLKEKYKLSPYLSVTDIPLKDNHQVSSLRSNTTNNTTTLIKDSKSLLNTSKRTNGFTRNYSRETNDYLVRTSLRAMKQYQNSLRRDTSVPNYKPRKKSTRMKPIVIPNYKQKKMIPFAYLMNKKPVMQLKDYAMKQPKKKDSRDKDNDCDCFNNGVKSKLKKLIEMCYVKMSHNALLLVLLKASTLYNKRIKQTVKPKNNKILLHKKKTKGNIKTIYPPSNALTQAPTQSIISVKDQGSSNPDKTLNRNKSVTRIKSLIKKTIHRDKTPSQRLPFK